MEERGVFGLSGPADGPKRPPYEPGIPATKHKPKKNSIGGPNGIGEENTLAIATRGRVRRRPLADCTNSLKSDDSPSSSSVYLLKKPQLPSHTCIPLAGDGVSAGAAGGHQKSAAHHGGRHAVKRKYPTAAVMATAPAIVDSSGNLNEIKDCDVSRSIMLPEKRQKQHLRDRPRKESDQALEDYITQQLIYFAEVDAYELEEEKVAEAEALE